MSLRLNRSACFVSVLDSCNCFHNNYYDAYTKIMLKILTNNVIIKRIILATMNNFNKKLFKNNFYPYFLQRPCSNVYQFFCLRNVNSLNIFIFQNSNVAKKKNYILYKCVRILFWNNSPANICSNIKYQLIYFF